jgi:hypothetical protein
MHSLCCISATNPRNVCGNDTNLVNNILKPIQKSEFQSLNDITIINPSKVRVDDADNNSLNSNFKSPNNINTINSNGVYKGCIL